MTINRDAWLSALRAVEPATDPDALSRAELSELFGCQATATKDRARKMVAAGLAIKTTKIVLDAEGRPHRVPAYRLVARKG